MSPEIKNPEGFSFMICMSSGELVSTFSLEIHACRQKPKLQKTGHEKDADASNKTQLPNGQKKTSERTALSPV